MITREDLKQRAEFHRIMFEDMRLEEDSASKNRNIDQPIGVHMRTAWRFMNNGKPAYVEWIGNGQQRGDRYSYTSDASKAKPMTEAQCRAFCSYMRDCATVGFWS